MVIEEKGVDIKALEYHRAELMSSKADELEIQCLVNIS